MVRSKISNRKSEIYRLLTLQPSVDGSLSLTLKFGDRQIEKND